MPNYKRRQEKGKNGKSGQLRNLSHFPRREILIYRNPLGQYFHKLDKIKNFINSARCWVFTQCRYRGPLPRLNNTTESFSPCSEEFFSLRAKNWHSPVLSVPVCLYSALPAAGCIISFFHSVRFIPNVAPSCSSCSDDFEVLSSKRRTSESRPYALAQFRAHPSSISSASKRSAAKSITGCTEWVATFNTDVGIWRKKRELNRATIASAARIYQGEIKNFLNNMHWQPKFFFPLWQIWWQILSHQSEGGGRGTGSGDPHPRVPYYLLLRSMTGKLPC